MRPHLVRSSPESRHSELSTKSEVAAHHAYRTTSLKVYMEDFCDHRLGDEEFGVVGAPFEARAAGLGGFESFGRLEGLDLVSDRPDAAKSSSVNSMMSASSTRRATFSNSRSCRTLSK
jgi:hypothetical protein